MAVRNTEKRIPQVTGIASAADLGQTAAAAGNANVILISYLSSPIAVRRLQNYVVFVTDPAFAATVNSYNWTFTNGVPTSLTTTNGVAEFTPQNTGPLSVTVKLMNAGNVAISTVNMTQQVVVLNPELELLVEEEEVIFPKAAHPETSREMINDLRMYINNILPIATDENFNKLISSIAYARALEIPGKENETPSWKRNIYIEDHARVLNKVPLKFFDSAKNGFGVCKTRPQLVALLIQNSQTGKPFIDPAIELPSGANKTQVTETDKQLKEAFDKLSADAMIDIFNVLRFPKSHFSICKKIIEELATRYYPTENLQKLLPVKTKVLSLLTEYETGLKAFTKDLKGTPISNKIFSLISNPIWKLSVLPLAGSTGAAGTSTTSAAGQIGKPEMIPSHTFIAEDSTETGFGPLSAGFLQRAEEYHSKFAISTQRIASMEKLIEKLSTVPGNISRLRIVTHFGGRAMVGPLGKGVIFIPFFTGQLDENQNDDVKTHFWHFAYGVSDEEGLKAFFVHGYLPDNTDAYSGSLSHNTVSSSDKKVHDLVIIQLQKVKDPVLKPFGIQTKQPTGAALSLIRWAADLMLINSGASLEVKAPNKTPSALPALVKAGIKTFVEEKIKSFYQTSGAFIDSNVNALRDRIAGMTLSEIGSTASSFNIEVPEVYLDPHNQLRTQLATVRSKLNNAFIDARGCRIGQDKQFMQEFRKFFGNPTVSGPEWYQMFGFLLFSNPVDEFQVDWAFNKGLKFPLGPTVTAEFTVQDVLREYTFWAGRIGINSHLSFWLNLVNAEPFDMLTLKWKANLPVLAMESARLKKIITDNYVDTFKTIRQIFFINAAVKPTDADLASFSSGFLSHVNTLQTIQEAVSLLTNALPQGTLNAQMTSIQNLASTLGQTLTVPPPSSMTKDHLQVSIDQLKAFLVTKSEIGQLIPELKKKLTDPKAGFKYMMAIGLGLPVQKQGKEEWICLLHFDPEKENAVKSWYKTHWANPLPATVNTAIDNLSVPQVDDTTLRYVAVTLNHEKTKVAITPSEEYMIHMITEP